MAQLDDQLVTPEFFGEISCLDGLVFGVNTSCKSCEYEFKPCLRRHLREALRENQHLAERELGYALSVAYHVDEIIWRGTRRYELNLKGVSQVGISQVVYLLDGTFEVSPFVVEDAEIMSDIGDFNYVSVSTKLIDNPSSAIFRNVDSNSVIEQDIVSGYPKRVAGNWLIPIDGNTDEDFVNIQNCKQIPVTVPTFAQDYIYAVLPGTYKVIPYSKDPVVNSDDTTTYWFYAWSLLDPAFYEEELNDLEAGEFFKLLPEINFAYAEESDTAAIIVWSDGTTSDDSVTVTQFMDNVITVKWTAEFEATCSVKTPIKLMVYYKTDPQVLGVDTDQMAEAIVYLTAAELPITACNCPPVEFGFIAEAQKSYTSFVGIDNSGNTYMPIRYGDKHGQRVFWERIQHAKIASKRKGIRI